MVPEHVGVLKFRVGALTYFNISKCSHASLHPGKAGSCKEPLKLTARINECIKTQGYLHMGN